MTSLKTKLLKTDWFLPMVLQTMLADSTLSKYFLRNLFIVQLLLQPYANNSKFSNRRLFHYFSDFHLPTSIFSHMLVSLTLYVLMTFAKVSHTLCKYNHTIIIPTILFLNSNERFFHLAKMIHIYIVHSWNNNSDAILITLYFKMYQYPKWRRVWNFLDYF